MEETNNATEANVESIATPEPTEAELKIVALEAEKSKLLEVGENYRQAYLKEVEKHKETGGAESEEDRVRRIIREEEAAKRLIAIDAEKEELLAKTLKENKELKLAQLNKTVTPPAAMGGHTESVAPTDTRVTPEQLAYFKSRGWTDKDIERYKRNFSKNSR